MPKSLKPDDRKRWSAYLRIIETGAEFENLSEESLREHFASVQGEPLTDQGTIEGSTLTGVIIRLPAGERKVSFAEIVAADAVLRYWLVRGECPTKGPDGDFRNPPDALGLSPIPNSTYAPALAERFRRSVAEAARPG